MHRPFRTDLKHPVNQLKIVVANDGEDVVFVKDALEAGEVGVGIIELFAIVSEQLFEAVAD